MSEVLKIMGLNADDGFNLVVLLPAVVVLVVIAFLFKFSTRKQEATKKSNTQNIKKDRKMPTSKLKEEKSKNDKKDKSDKEKKTFGSPVKMVDSSSGVDAVQIKTNKKQPVTNEKSKKAIQIKKQQVANNVNLKSPLTQNQTKALIETFISQEEEGEWQKVTTKKHKLSKQEDPTNDVNNSPSKSSKSQKKAAEKSNKSSPKSKKVEVSNIQNNTPVVIGRELPLSEAHHIAELEPIDQMSNFSNNINQHEKLLPESSTSNLIAPTNNIKLKTLTAQSVAPISNVLFDDLGDDGWTDKKPQKKNRKKALRE